MKTRAKCKLYVPGGEAIEFASSITVQFGPTKVKVWLTKSSCP